MWMLSRLSVIGSLVWIFGTYSLAPAALAGFSLFRMPVVDIPVSLAKGKVTTNEFGSKNNETYSILIRAQRGRLPFADMNCMMGVTWGESSSFNCDREPLLKADWWVYDKGQCVAAGEAYERGRGASSNHTLERYLGHFQGQAGQKYVLEILFAADGSPLNVTIPHLVVEINKPWD